MLKYIILTESDGQQVALFCLAPTKHLELVLMAQAHKPSRTIVSAGFVDFTYAVPKGAAPGSGCQLIARTYGSSESVNKSPRPEDAAFLTAFARATADLAAASITALAAAR